MKGSENVGDGGQALPLVVLLVLALLAGAVVLAEVGLALEERARARTAADAAALAGAAAGEDAAGELAAANGGVLEEFRREGPEVEVTVRVGRARAVARATSVPRTPTFLRSGSGDLLHSRAVPESPTP